MSITLNLDDATTVELERVAQATGVSPSQLITQLVKQYGFALPIAPLGTASVPPPLPPPHDFGNPAAFDYRKAMAMLDEEEASAFREKMDPDR